MNRTLTRFGTALLIAVSAVGISACSAADAPAAHPSDSLAPTPTSPAPTPVATPTTTADSEPTCQNIIPARTISDFESVGWTVKPEVFRIGGEEIPDGVQCTWGDYTVASDHVQIYGWAPLKAADATEHIQQLVAEGWRREESAEGVYVTENPDTAIATDQQGYGLTYLFSDGWVKFADTRLGLVLVEWPRG